MCSMFAPCRDAAVPGTAAVMYHLAAHHAALPIAVEPQDIVTLCTLCAPAFALDFVLGSAHPPAHQCKSSDSKGGCTQNIVGPLKKWCNWRWQALGRAAVALKQLRQREASAEAHSDQADGHAFASSVARTAGRQAMMQGIVGAGAIA